MIFWIMVMVALAVTFYILEVFIPSGGILGILSVLCLVVCLVLLFMLDTRYGMVGLVMTAVLIPCAVLFSLYVFPKTFVGKALTQRAVSVNKHYKDEEEKAALVGQQGVAISEMRPIGTCMIGGEKMECYSVSGMLEKDVNVEVVSVRGLEVKVKVISA